MVEGGGGGWNYLRTMLAGKINPPCPDLVIFLDG